MKDRELKRHRDVQAAITQRCEALAYYYSVPYVVVEYSGKFVTRQESHVRVKARVVYRSGYGYTGE